MLEADAKRNFGVYAAVERDLRFDKIRGTPEFQSVRQSRMACQQRYAQFASPRFD